MMARRRRAGGFTLIELIIVLVLMTIVGATVAVFVKPTIDAYSDTRNRAVLGDMGDTALRRMTRDMRVAVPNSLRTPNEACFELVPAVAGGRYRMGPNAANNAWWVNTAGSTTGFDVLSTLTRQPAVNDFVVINNQNGNDVATFAALEQLSIRLGPMAVPGWLLRCAAELPTTRLRARRGVCCGSAGDRDGVGALLCCLELPTCKPATGVTPLRLLARHGGC